MAPQTLVTALVLSPDGSVELDAGALHGRSVFESQFQFVKPKTLVPNSQTAWIIWVAIELDASNQPLRYKGLSTSELLVNLQHRLGYKSLADQVNRISEAIQGQASVARLDASARRVVVEKLRQLDAKLWEHADPALRAALES